MKNVEKNVKYVWAKQNVVEDRTFGSTKFGIMKGKRYEVHSEFETDEVSSGLCYVVLTEYNKLTGYDSNYFITDLEYESNKYNI
ncbi:hypothetical protein K9L67_06005 [Candidatus Woesearchaeota archaeon]|nr:hypothetical protein [Candidatus Woesearchaeota archaeon]MCF7901747.1 hypothetical protein [Candidatus Woesearchaeota archaeon]